MRRLFPFLAWMAVLFLAVCADGTETTLNSASLDNGLDALGGSARALALGSAYVAVPGDSDSIFWNPAGLAEMDSPEISLHHNSWLPGVFQETLVFALPAESLGTFGLSASYLDFGSFDQRNSSGDPTGSYSVNRWGLGLSWGKNWAPNLALGGAVKGALENTAGTQMVNLSMDLGLTWSPLDSLVLGLAWTNWGTYYQGSPIAEAIRGGLSYHFSTDPTSQTLLTAAYAYQPYGVDRLEGGVEEVLHSFLALRAGYVYSLQNNQWGGLSGLTAGIGFHFSDFNLDYAYLPYGDLGTTHRVSLAYRFESSPKTNASTPTSTPSVQTTVKTSPSWTPSPTVVATPPPTQAQTPLPTLTPKNNLELYFALPENQPVVEPTSNTQTAADIEKYLARIRVNSKDVKAWLGLGVKYAQSHNWSRSIQCLEQALRLEPGNAIAKAWLQWVQKQAP